MPGWSPPARRRRAGSSLPLPRPRRSRAVRLSAHNRPGGRDVRWYEDADLRPVRDGFGHHLPPCRWPRRRLEAARLVGEVLVAGVRVGRVCWPAQGDPGHLGLGVLFRRFEPVSAAAGAGLATVLLLRADAGAGVPLGMGAFRCAGVTGEWSVRAGGERREDGGPDGFPVLAQAGVHAGRLRVGVDGGGQFEGDSEPVFDGAE